MGLQGYQVRKIAFGLGLSGNAFKEMTKFIYSLYNAYDKIDASMFEINPVLKTSRSMGKYPNMLENFGLGGVH